MQGCPSASQTVVQRDHVVGRQGRFLLVVGDVDGGRDGLLLEAAQAGRPVATDGSRSVGRGGAGRGRPAAGPWSMPLGQHWRVRAQQDRGALWQVNAVLGAGEASLQRSI